MQLWREPKSPDHVQQQEESIATPFSIIYSQCMSSLGEAGQCFGGLAI